MFVFVLIFFSLQMVNAETSEQPWRPESGKHFVLIHGACLGAWSWYKQVQLLKSAGHNVTALDLAASGVDPKQVKDVPSISDYFQPLMDFLVSLPSHERVILVGHSLGGLAISHAMERFPEKIFVAVFVSALMPGPTLNISTLNQEDLALAMLLLRPLRLYSDEDMSKVLMMSSKRYGSVDRVFAICDEDKLVKKGFQRWMVEKNPPMKWWRSQEAITWP
ncbi:unnamed protein product [Ilex paraguariensis]|uniref:AB hydrolase-1 domain-containing protein n=1 Tax=Ilex paraguariensis TaxID=185542 RepID=A0ABC8UFF1_9AQUA